MQARWGRKGSAGILPAPNYVSPRHEEVAAENAIPTLPAWCGAAAFTEQAWRPIRMQTEDRGEGGSRN